jgi:hypothetical protein
MWKQRLRKPAADYDDQMAAFSSFPSAMTRGRIV